MTPTTIRGLRKFQGRPVCTVLGFGLAALAAAPVAAGPADAALAAGSANPGVELQNVEATRPALSERHSPDFSMPTRPPMNAPVGSFKLDLERFNIEGNTVFSDQSLGHLVSDIVGRRVSFADLLRAANKITNFYRDAGYLVARAYVPEQEIQGGAVEIRILEGLVGEVTVSNGTGQRDSLVNGMLHKVRKGTVVSRGNVERTVLLLNDLPGVDASATFKVGKQEGTTDLDVDLSAGRRISGALDANNYGSEFTGVARAGGSLQVNGLAGFGDALGIRLLTSENSDTVYGSINYSVAAGTSGTRFGIKYSNLESDIGEEFEVLDLESEADTWGVFATHPFIRSRDLNLFGQLSWEKRDVSQEFGGDLSEASSRDEISVLSLAVNGDYRDGSLAGSVSTYGFAWQQGIDSFGPFDPSRVGASSRFTKIGLNYSRLQYFNDSTSLLFKVAGQFTEDALVSSEQFSLSGPNAVRAFVSGEGLADSGWVATAELRRSFAVGTSLVRNAQLFGFYDIGYGSLNNTPLGSDDNVDVSGVGLGVKLGIIGNYQVDLSYAHSLTGNGVTEEEENGKVLFQAIKWF